MNGTNGTNHLGVNLAFTKFLFITPSRDDMERAEEAEELDV